MTIDSKEVHDLWRDLRDAAGSMSLWGQVAAAEVGAAIEKRPCLLGSLLGASSDADHCPAWGGVEGRATLSART